MYIIFCFNFKLSESLYWSVYFVFLYFYLGNIDFFRICRKSCYLEGKTVNVIPAQVGIWVEKRKCHFGLDPESS